MRIITTAEFDKRYKKLSIIVQKKSEKQEKIFRSNPFHPSLHTEKLEPKNKELQVRLVQLDASQSEPPFPQGLGLTLQPCILFPTCRSRKRAALFYY